MVSEGTLVNHWRCLPVLLGIVIERLCQTTQHTYVRSLSTWQEYASSSSKQPSPHACCDSEVFSSARDKELLKHQPLQTYNMVPKIKSIRELPSNKTGSH